MTRLSLFQNTLMANLMHSVLTFTPLLVALDLQGIYLKSNIDMSSLKNLKSFCLDYFHDFTKIIKTISSTEFKELIVICRLGKCSKKRKPVIFDNIKKLFFVLSSFEFRFYKCKIKEPYWFKNKIGNK